MKIMKEHADIEITSSGDNEEEREEGLFMGKIWKKVAAFIAIAVFAATILTISLFVFRSDKGNEESPSQVEIDNIMTTNLFESLMKSGDRHLGERYLGENITSFLSETTQMRSVDFDSSANLELVHGIVTNPDVLVIRVNGNIPSLYENNGNIGGEAVMIIFTQNEKLQIVLELKTTDADTVSSLITEPNTTHAYHQLKFARDNPVSLILSTINEDVSKFELGETCGSTSKQSRGLNICAKLLATSNVTSVVQDAYDFTGQDSSEEHDRTLIGTLRPVVKLESRSEHWDELSLSEYVWVSDLKVHFGSDITYIAGTVHVRIGQNDELEIYANISKEQNNVYEMKVEGSVHNKEWQLPGHQTVSLQYIDLDLIYNNNTQTKVTGIINASVILGHSIELDLSVIVPPPLLEVHGNLVSNFTLNQLVGSSNDDYEDDDIVFAKEDAYFIFSESRGCHINAMIQVGRSSYALRGMISDLNSNLTEIEVSGEFDTRDKSFDFTASLMNFQFDEDVEFDDVTLHVSSRENSRFYVSCNAHIIDLDFFLSARYFNHQLRFQGNASGEWSTPHVSLTKFSLDITRNLTSQETEDLRIMTTAEFISSSSTTDFKTQLIGTKKAAECFEFRGTASWQHDIERFALESTGVMSLSSTWQSSQINSALEASTETIEFMIQPKCGRIEFSGTFESPTMGTASIVVSGTTLTSFANSSWIVAVEPLQRAYTYMSLQDVAFIASSSENIQSYTLRSDNQRVVNVPPHSVSIFGNAKISALSIENLYVSLLLEDKNGTISEEFDVELEDTFTFPHDITLRHVILHISSNRDFEFTSQLSVLAMGHVLNLTLQGHLTENLIDFEADADVMWPIPLPNNGFLDVNSVTVQCVVSSAGNTRTIRGSIESEATLYGNVSATVRLDLQESVQSVSLDLSSSPPISIRSLFERMTDDGTTFLTSSGGSTFLDVKFVRATAKLQSNPISFELTALTRVFSDSEDVSVVLRTQENNIYVVGAELGTSISPADAIPSLSGAFDETHFADCGVVVSSSACSVTFPESKPYNVLRGLTFFARFSFGTDSPLEIVNKWTGISNAIVLGNIDISDESFRIQGSIQGDIHPISFIHLTELGVFISRQGGVQTAKFGFETQLYLSLRNENLTFMSDMYVEPAPLTDAVNLGFDAEMTKNYDNAFGVRGLVLDRTAIELGLSCHLNPVTGVDCEPTKIGLGSGVHYCGIGAEADFEIDLQDTDNMLIFVELDQFHLENLINDALIALHVNTHLNHSLANIGFNHTEFYFNLATKSITFNGREFPPGFAVEVDGFNMYDIFIGSASMEIFEEEGFSLSADIQPFTLGDFFTLSGTEGPNSDAVMNIIMRTNKQHVKVDAATTILGQSLACYVDLDDSKMDMMIDTHLLHDLFEFQLKLSMIGHVPTPSDWDISGEMNQEVLDYIHDKVGGQINSSKASCLSQIDRWEQDIERHLQNMTSLNESIARRVQEDMAAVGDLEKDFIKWRGDVHDQQGKVDRLQEKIDSTLDEIHKLHWYEEWKAPGLYVVVGALEVAKGVADLALEAAQEGLTLAVDALQASGRTLPEIDPVVIVLRGAYWIEHAALTFAQEALKTLGNNICNVIQWIETEIVRLSDFLNIRTIKVSGSAKRLKNFDLGNVEIEGIVLGREFNHTFEMNWSGLENLAGNIYTAIVHDHTPEDTARKSERYSDGGRFYLG